jgi:hypothetical protein
MGCIFGCRGCHRVDNDRRFLSLKLVHCARANSSRTDPFLEQSDLSIVWSNYQNVVRCHGLYPAVPVNPLRSRLQKAGNDAIDLIRLLEGVALILVMPNGVNPEPGPFKGSSPHKHLSLKTLTRK